MASDVHAIGISGIIYVVQYFPCCIWTALTRKRNWYIMRTTYNCTLLSIQPLWCNNYIGGGLKPTNFLITILFSFFWSGGGGGCWRSSAFQEEHTCLLRKLASLISHIAKWSVVPLKVRRVNTPKTNTKGITNASDYLILAANSPSTCIDWSSSFKSVVGTISVYTVSSAEVYAFWQAPKEAPILSRNVTISWLL